MICLRVDLVPDLVPDLIPDLVPDLVPVLRGHSLTTLTALFLAFINHSRNP